MPGGGFRGAGVPEYQDCGFRGVGVGGGGGPGRRGCGIPGLGLRGWGVPDYQDWGEGNGDKKLIVSFFLQNIIYCITKQHIIHKST